MNQGAITCPACATRLHLRNTGQGGASWMGNGKCAQCDRNAAHVFQKLKIFSIRTTTNEKNIETP